MARNGFPHDTRRNPFLPHLPTGCSLLGILPEEPFLSLSKSPSLVFTGEAGMCRVGAQCCVRTSSFDCLDNPSRE